MGSTVAGLISGTGGGFTVAHSLVMSMAGAGRAPSRDDGGKYGDAAGRRDEMLHVLLPSDVDLVWDRPMIGTR